MKILFILLFLMGCGVEEYVEQKEAEWQDGYETIEEKSEESEYTCTLSQKIPQTCYKNYKLTHEKTGWEQAVINAPEGMRLATRYEIVKQYDDGKFDWADHDDILVWSNSTDKYDRPWAVHIGSGNSTVHTGGNKFIALYVTDCEVNNEN